MTEQFLRENSYLILFASTVILMIVGGLIINLIGYYMDKNTEKGNKNEVEHITSKESGKKTK